MSAEEALLAEVPLFALLDGDERSVLSELLETKSFAAGTRLFSYGDAGDALYIVRRGKVQIFVENSVGETIVLAENGPGDVFGEISLLDGGPRTAGAVALEDSEVLAFGRDDLLAFVARQPHAALDLLTVMGRRLRATNELLRSRSVRNANVEERERLTFGQRIADRVAAFGGSWTFILLFGGILFAWMVINSLAAFHIFDPPPFILLNLILSTLAALQAPVIMMSQNRQSAKDRLKSDLDYEVNLMAEREIAQLHVKLDHIYEEMQAHFARREKAGSAAAAQRRGLSL